VFHSRVYGLHVASAISLEGMGTTKDAEPDCELHVGPVDMLPAGDAIALDTSRLTEQGDPGTRIEQSAANLSTYVFEFADGTRFRVEERGRRITGQSPTPEDLATYFLGPILAFIVRLRGGLALHAGAVAIDGRALLITGMGGAGKSTTTAALLQRGASLLTDDVAVIDWKAGTPHVFPGYARVRLWDDSAASLFGSADALPMLTPTWSKRFVDAREQFTQVSVPIRALIVLMPREHAPPRVRRLTGHEAAMALLLRTSLTYLLSPEQRKAELDEVTRLAGRIPIVELTPRDDLGAMDELLECITAAIP
jgi:hypothetical protein